MGLASSRIPICGSCCIITSLFTEYPECIGAREEVIFTCIEMESVCCKPKQGANQVWQL